MADFYDYWLKFDKWSYKQAALIFNGHDPSKFESEIDFSLKLNELDRYCKDEWHKDVIMSYVLLRNINWLPYYPGGSSKFSITLMQLFAMAKDKDIRLPDDLVKNLSNKPELYKIYSYSVESETVGMEVARSKKRPPAEGDLAEAFDPLPLPTIANMFRLVKDEEQNLNKWRILASKASRNGLNKSRVSTGRGRAESTFDPLRVGEWVIQNQGFTQEFVNKKLANNLPERSKDLKDDILL